MLDPFEVFARGEPALRDALQGFSVDQLKDIVSEHAMDSSKLALKWRSPDRLIELIVTTVRSRIEKGDAFKRDFVSQDTGASDKQQGWNDALNIVLGQFHDVAWQKGLYQERTRAAEDMEKLSKRKCLEKSEDDYQQTMFGVVTPFCEMLKGGPQGQPPLKIELPEAERQGRNDALEIVLDTFRGFAHRKGLELEWTCSEIAEDMKKLAKHEGREKSQDYQQAMANVVRPFYNMLKGDPQGQPPFNT